MTELPDRVDRAFRDHDGFERVGPGRYESTATPFEASVAAEAREEGGPTVRLTVRVPTLSAATEDAVGDAVAEGWYETFTLRVADVGGVTRTDREFDPAVDREDGTVTVTYTIKGGDPRRVVKDAAALVTFVEGTYLQGVVPGYDYREPVAGLRSAAREAGGGG